MQMTSSGKVRRSESEWRAIFKRWEQSGQSRIAYCKQEGISKASFDKWKRRLSKQSDSPPSSFIEIPVPSNDRASGVTGSGGEFEIVFPGGVVLRWKS